MKNVLMLFVCFSFICFSCSDDDTPDVVEYKVDININSPADNSSFSALELVPIEVVFNRSADEVIHHVKVELIDDAGNTVKTLLDEHAHTPETYTFANDTGLSISDIGTYTLRASSHDMDGNHAEPVEITISAQ